ncbi:MAG: spermidine synthase, partial [Gallionellaceae bacterium]
AHPGDLNTLAFYQNCRSRLTDIGLLVVNLIGLCHGIKGGFAYVETAFENRALMLPKCKSGNTIAIAVNGREINLSCDELKERSRALEARTNLALMPTLTKLENDPLCQQGRLVL